MRVTNSMLISTFLNNLNKNTKGMEKYQRQLSSNSRLARLSDDPIGVINVLGVKSKIRKLAQYQNNVDDARAWLTQTETAVLEINNVIKSTYEQALQVANGTNSTEEYDAVLSYVTQMRNHIIQIANSTYGEKYIFGGYNTSKTPIVDDSGTLKYNGYDLYTMSDTIAEELKNQIIQYDIGSGLKTDVSVSGVELLGYGDNNIIKIYDELIETLKSGAETEKISAIADKLKVKQSDILSIAADIGGRTNRLDLVASRYESDAINYETVRSNVEDIDMAEVIMNLKFAEAVYNAALAAGARIIQPSLLEFLG